MNFQLHMPHGVLLFFMLAAALAYVGFKVGRLLTRNARKGGGGEDRMTEGVTTIILLVVGALFVVASIVMAFTTPYAAYAMLAAVFCFGAARGA